MDPLTAIAERRIQEAIERGEFDDLPGKGKPLHLGEDDRTVPEELRMAYRMLKNAGLLPPEVELHKEILRLTDLLDAVHDEEGRRERRRELDYKLMKLNMMLRRPVNLEGSPEYRDRVEEKLSRGGASTRSPTASPFPGMKFRAPSGAPPSRSRENASQPLTGERLDGL